MHRLCWNSMPYGIPGQLPVLFHRKLPQNSNCCLKGLLRFSMHKVVNTCPSTSNLGLPNRVQVTGVEVLEGILEGCDVLIGMDIINLGDFAVTNRDDVTVLSFQMPSVNRIDFVKLLEESERKDN